MTPFKERMNLYRAYRELNPGKNYWDWKASVSKQDNDWGYQEWKRNLPENLKYESPDYDLYGAYKSGMQPVLESDGVYHLGSRDPQTGRILKRKGHPTYLLAIDAEKAMGYDVYEGDDGYTYSQPRVPAMLDGGDALSNLQDDNQLKYKSSKVKYNTDPSTFTKNLYNRIVPIPALMPEGLIWGGIRQYFEHSDEQAKNVFSEKNMGPLDESVFNDVRDGINNGSLGMVETMEPYILEDTKDLYLGMPQRNNTYEYSDYKPKNAKSKQYYKNKFLEEAASPILINVGNDIKLNRTIPKDDFMPYGKAYEITKNKNALAVLPGYGHATVGIGMDPKKGEYVSYYDKWDIGLGIENTKHPLDYFYDPVNIYGRVYLDDYYGVNSAPNEGDYYGGYLPEITVKPNSYADGGVVPAMRFGGETLPGGYTEDYWSLAARKDRHRSLDPTFRFSPEALLFDNAATGEEDLYWRAYLGLDNWVPAMDENAKTEWDDEKEAERIAEGKLPSEFFGTTLKMDLNLQAVADTLHLGEIYRNYDEYAKNNPDVPTKRSIKKAYDYAKKVMDHPGEWQLMDANQYTLFPNKSMENNEYDPLGMLGEYGMKWVPEDKALYVHDTYDFPWYAKMAGKLKDRPHEMKIRSKIKFDPKKGAKLFRNK